MLHNSVSGIVVHKVSPGDGSYAIRWIGVPSGLTVTFDPAISDIGAAYTIAAWASEIEPVA